MRARIAILVHEHAEDFWTSQYFLRALAETWRADGLDVAIVRGPRRFVEADVAIVHLDLTVIPDEYVELAHRYRVVINGRARDISKRVVSRHLVARGDGWDGPVIVKTNRNFGGQPEAWLAARRSIWGLLSLRARRRLPTRWGGHVDPHAYPIFDSVARVPAWMWRDQRLVVERFLPERRDGVYCLRQWTFLGDGELHRLSRSELPIVKANATGERLELGPVPSELRAERERLGIDYGKLDYAVVGNEVLLYDANRTPFFSRAMPPSSLEAALRAVAGGIRSFLARR